MRNCTADSVGGIMRNEDWVHPEYAYPDSCYFYPHHACPGWSSLGVCGRIGQQIPRHTGTGDARA